MGNETHDITYEGAAAFASLLVQILEDEGIEVQWERPVEERGAVEPADVVVGMVARGGYDLIKAAIIKFRGRGRVTLDGDEVIPWYLLRTDGSPETDPQFLSRSGTWGTIAEARPFATEDDAAQAPCPYGTHGRPSRSTGSP